MTRYVRGRGRETPPGWLRSAGHSTYRWLGGHAVIAKRGRHHPDIVTIALTVLTVGTLLCVLSWAH
jgi:hypothetical protein